MKGADLAAVAARVEEADRRAAEADPAAVVGARRAAAVVAAVVPAARVDRVGAAEEVVVGGLV
ncbi:MAG TPA: hypothetical protein VIM84_00270, partial [Gemmatimonadales bacterium]